MTQRDLAKWRNGGPLALRHGINSSAAHDTHSCIALLVQYRGLRAHWLMTSGLNEGRWFMIRPLRSCLRVV